MFLCVAERFWSVFFLNGKCSLSDHAPVCMSFQILKQIPDDEIWYESYATKGHSNLFYFLNSYNQ